MDRIETMDRLIEVINKLQEVFAKTSIGKLENEIQLPQIVVIGAQSAGKSSVLENIVGHDFLPRGTGIVTRRPLVLQMISCPKDDRLRRETNVPDEEDWAKFGHREDVYTNFEEVRKEIERDTDAKAGSNKGIISQEIVLSIFSQHSITLSLVDLPGVVKNPVGDQPHDIGKQVRDMILEKIRNPNSLILAVTAANQDIATSDAIELAKEVDPDGDRTIAVLTKLDLMDPGTNAFEALTGEIIPVKLGIYGVVNRSQMGIKNNLPIQQALENEEQFLSANYPTIARQNGVPHLKRKLHDLLMKHIKKCMPTLNKRIVAKIKDSEDLLDKLGEPIVDRHRAFVRLVHSFAQDYTKAIKEGVSLKTDPNERNSLLGGAKISFIFHNTFYNKLEAMKPTSQLTNDEILLDMLRASGLRPTLLGPEYCFEGMVKKEIEHFEKPCLDCTEEAFKEMIKVVRNTVYKNTFFVRFPIFWAKVIPVVEKLLEAQSQVAQKHVKDQIKFHLSYINTKHPDFKAEKRLLKLLKTDQAEAKKIGKQMNLDSSDSEEEGKLAYGVNSEDDNMTEQEKKNVKLIRSLIRNYVQIVRKTLQDVVPKAIFFAMIEYVEENLSTELMEKLHADAELHDYWLDENEETEQKRIITEAQLKTLKAAHRVVEMYQYAY